jgi:hypothetical protein
MAVNNYADCILQYILLNRIIIYCGFIYKYIVHPVRVTFLFADGCTCLCPVEGEHASSAQATFSPQSLNHFTCCN